MKRLTDPTFKYYSDTDLRRTFARVRREQKRRQVEKQADARLLSHVVPLRTAK